MTISLPSQSVAEIPITGVLTAKLAFLKSTTDWKAMLPTANTDRSKKRKNGIVLWIDPEDYEDWGQKTS